MFVCRHCGYVSHSDGVDCCNNQRCRFFRRNQCDCQMRDCDRKNDYERNECLCKCDRKPDCLTTCNKCGCDDKCKDTCKDKCCGDNGDEGVVNPVSAADSCSGLREYEKALRDRKNGACFKERHCCCNPLSNGSCSRAEHTKEHSFCCADKCNSQQDKSKNCCNSGHNDDNRKCCGNFDDKSRCKIKCRDKCDRFDDNKYNDDNIRCNDRCNECCDVNSEYCEEGISKKCHNMLMKGCSQPARNVCQAVHHCSPASPCQSIQKQGQGKQCYLMPEVKSCGMLGLATLPFQQYCDTYDTENALHAGTLFAGLDMPYTKRIIRRG